jgi:hypothetical protein
MRPHDALEPAPDGRLDPLADAYRGALATRRVSAADCPAPAALARLAAGALDEGERFSLVDHLALCADCAAEWRAARELDSWAARAAAPANQMEARPRRGFAPRFAWAAAALVAMAGLGLLLPAVRERDEELRALPAAGVGQSVLPPHGARLAEVPAELAWRRPVAARVELYDAALRPLGDSGGAVTSPWPVPDELKHRMRRRGGRIHWRLVVAGEVGPEASALAVFELPAAP